MEEPERSMIGADWLGALGSWFAQVVEFVKGERNAFPCLKEGNQSMSMAPLAPEARFWTHLKLQMRNCRSVLPSPLGMVMIGM